MDVTDYVIKEIEKNGITQLHLCRNTGIKSPKLSNFINRHGALYPDELMLLLSALGCRVMLPDGTHMVLGPPEFNMPKSQPETTEP